MKTTKIISLYRKAKKHNIDARMELQNIYIHEQLLYLPSKLYNWSGLMGHTSAFYTADIYKNQYNKELYAALCYAAGSYLEDEEKRMAS